MSFVARMERSEMLGSVRKESRIATLAACGPRLTKKLRLGRRWRFQMVVALAVLIVLSMLGGSTSAQNLFNPAPTSGGKPQVEDGSGMKNDCILAAAGAFAAIPGAKIVGSVAGPAVNEGNPDKKMADIWGMEIGIRYEAAGISGRMFFRCEWWEGSRPIITREARPRTISEDF